MSKQLLFIGDSLTEWGCWNELFPDYQIENKGIAGEKTSGILKRLPQYAQLRPINIFFMAGINDLGDCISVNSILENYHKLMQLILSIWGTNNSYFLSVLPVHFESFKHTSISPENIEKLNNGIGKLCLQLKTNYLNIAEAFTDGKGNLNPIYSNDGLHLNKAGYLIWKQAIEKYIKN